MLSEINFRPWGLEYVLDEESTVHLLTGMEQVGDVAALAAIVSPLDPESKIVVGAANACWKLGRDCIKAVDESGGKNGVIMKQLWVGPVCWIQPRQRE